MKAFKKVFATLLALVLIMGLCATALADGETTDTTKTGSITVQNAKSGQTYTAYQIFEVTLADTDNDGTNDAFAYTISSTSSAWWSTVLKYMGGETAATADNNGVYTGKGITLTPSAADKTRYVVTVDEKTFSAADFAQYLYAALEGYTVVASDATFDSDETYYTHEGGQYVKCEDLTAFEDGVTYYTQGSKLSVTAAATLTYDENTQTAKAENLDLGYYFVTSSVGSLANLTTTNPSVTIYDKNEQPPFDKEADDVDVEIGQTVNYKITGEVPSTTGYTSYTYKVTDTLSSGLTFNKDVTVKFGDDAQTITTVTASEPDTNGVTTYTIGTGDSQAKVYSKTDTTSGVTIYYSDENCNNKVDNQDLPFGDATILYTDNGFELYFDMVNHQTDVDKPITITYSAVVNENAKKGDTGNANDAKLEYSNDPNDSTSKEEAKDEVKVYTVDLTIDKYASNTENENDKSTKLEGAEFILVKKDAENNNAETYYQAVYAYTYTDSSSNTVTVYSANGTTYYSDISCETEATIPTDTTPTKGEFVKVNWVSDDTKATVVITGEDGAATFDGLEAGVTYYLRETKAPDGYNILTADKEVTISRTETTDESTGSVTVTITGDKVSVANSAGTELPSTGGIGTTIFYVVGSVLVIGAGVLLITKKRMSGSEK